MSNEAVIAELRKSLRKRKVELKRCDKRPVRRAMVADIIKRLESAVKAMQDDR